MVYFMAILAGCDMGASFHVGERVGEGIIEVFVGPENGGSVEILLHGVHGVHGVHGLVKLARRPDSKSRRIYNERVLGVCEREG